MEEELLPLNSKRDSGKTRLPGDAKDEEDDDDWDVVVVVVSWFRALLLLLLLRAGGAWWANENKKGMAVVLGIFIFRLFACSHNDFVNASFCSSFFFTISYYF